jgi:hypothetical protein
MAAHLKRGNRYNAACAACLSAARQGKDAAKIDAKDKARVRKQALDWLCADLALWTKQVEGRRPADRAEVHQKMKHWQQDRDLVSIRDAAALAKLPAEQRAACAKLWADVAALVKTAQGKAK